ncbi:acetolactate synthase 3 large subunit [Psychrosphaera ytuae]|uniref:Acetolactate synthase n=1 Tax=Psychrosphaera ytuae TaxID=2820710 RepID=A0A975DG71_9GAMM|nr:acetolactate synthase 3 large subunit [Psychrosphaera ytuae]QTH65065.1 acetolactate synthase 3 large subunit [Psychrosphaera ytuae]
MTEKLRLTGAQMVIQSLKELGTELLFGYPGGAVLDIYDALYQEPDIEHILVRHEQAATHAADGYARATGKPGVVLVTSGPGATNAITGIATAYMDSIPMVVISGQVPSSVIGQDAFQETDMIGCSRPIVKHSFLCLKTEDIPEYIAKAFYIATTGRPGPVVVDIPKDLVHNTPLYDFALPKNIEMRSYKPTKKGHQKQINKAVATLTSAKRPVIYTGGGLITSDKSAQLKELAEVLNAPVTNTLMGLGGFPGTHPQFLGMLGMHGTYEANSAMANADVILALGARFDDRVTNNIEKFCPNATIIHVDVDPATIAKIVNAHIPIVGDLSQVVDQLLARLYAIGYEPDTKAQQAWWTQIDQWRARDSLNYKKESVDAALTEGDQPKGSIQPQQVIEALYKVTDGDAFVCSDVGQHQMFAAQYYPFDKPRRWINSGGAGTMGFGFPAAMGVKLAYPDAQVVCVSGDGSIQMNIQELSTCLQYNIPVKIVLLNNSSLGMVRQWQDMIYQGRHSHSYMESLPDFTKLVEAYGHVGVTIDSADSLEQDLANALSIKDRLVFINVIVNEEEHVYPMQIKGGAVNDMWIRKGERS